MNATMNVDMPVRPLSALDGAALQSLYTAHIAHLLTRYTAAAEQCGFDALVIHAGAAVKQNPFDDQYWPLRPTPAFAHWLPLGVDDAVLIVGAGSRPKLVVPKVVDFWHSPHRPEGEHFWPSFDVEEVDGQEAGDRVVTEAISGRRIGFIGNDGARAQAWDIPAEAVNGADLMAKVDAIRVHKTAYELACMAEANVRALRGHRRVAEIFAAERCSEFALHLAYLAATGQDDEATPYKNIVAIGEHAAILHHIVYQKEVGASDARSLLIDAGATCMGYASDITRTYAAGASFSLAAAAGADTFAHLLEAMARLQDEVIARIAVDKPYEALHDEFHELLAQVLIDVGVARAGTSAQALVDSGVSRVFCPHGLGHSLGIQVHDVGCRLTEPRPENRFLRNTSTISPGQVFTIEPGCYFIPSLLDTLRESAIASALDWDLIAALGVFGGVRIEDNIVVSPGKTANLTRDNATAAP